MSDGVNAGSPFGHRTWAQLKDALDEAERFGQNRTNEVVELTTEISALRAKLAAVEKVVEAAKVVVENADATQRGWQRMHPAKAYLYREDGRITSLRAALAAWDEERGTR